VKRASRSYSHDGQTTRGGDGAARGSDSPSDRCPGRWHRAPSGGHRSGPPAEPAGGEPPAAVARRSGPAALDMVATGPAEPALLRRSGLGRPDHRLARRRRPPERQAAVRSWMVATGSAAAAPSTCRGVAGGTRSLAVVGTISIRVRSGTSTTRRVHSSVLGPPRRRRDPLESRREPAVSPAVIPLRPAAGPPRALHALYENGLIGRRPRVDSRP
jgi:hypothetical protein